MTADPHDEPRYRAALIALTREVDRVHTLCHDPFKAPELTIFALGALQTAAWNAQVEYAAMVRDDTKRASS